MMINYYLIYNNSNNNRILIDKSILEYKDWEVVLIGVLVFLLNIQNILYKMHIYD